MIKQPPDTAFKHWQRTLSSPNAQAPLTNIQEFEANFPKLNK